jgi:hypothetical protein
MHGVANAQQMRKLITTFARLFASLIVNDQCMRAPRVGMNRSARSDCVRYARTRSVHVNSVYAGTAQNTQEQRKNRIEAALKFSIIAALHRIARKESYHENDPVTLSTASSGADIAGNSGPPAAERSLGSPGRCARGVGQ